MKVSTEPAEAAKPSMSHSHMDRLNRFKMVGHQRVSLSLSVFVSLARFLSLHKDFPVGT